MIPLLALCLAAPPTPPPKETEFYEMLAGILTGSQMGPGEGWFHPAQTVLTWDRLAKAHALKPGESISKAKFRGPPTLFARLDRDGDGAVAEADLDWSDKSAYLRQLAHARGLMQRWDTDFDRKVDKEEWAKLFDRMAGKDGVLTPEAVQKLIYPPARPQANFSNPKDAPSMTVLLRGLFRNEIGSTFPGPTPGDIAPDFTLETHDGEQKIRLSDYRGKTPVVLVFGNFTCGPFRSVYPAVEELKKVYGDKVTFLGVYVREAHPEDGWHMPSNDRQGVKLPQPKTTPERIQVATKCAANLKMTMPLLVDTVADTVGHAYSGMPSRLVLIDRSGRVVYKTGRGPFGFRPPELDQQIAMLLREDEMAKAAGGQARVPLLADQDVWDRMPVLASGKGGGPVPNWAKAFALSLPRTTAGMLELDYTMRAKNPLDPKLRAKARHTAAVANKSPYAVATALADLKRAGGQLGDETDAERVAMQFAKRLSTEAYKITDAEFANVRKAMGDANTVALVLTIAYASFQDRLLVTLDIPLEAAGPMPPVAVTFLRPHKGHATAPTRPAPDNTVEAGGAVIDTDWKSMDFDGLQKLLNEQKDRPERIPVPAFDDLVKKMPGTFDPKRPLRIKWSLVAVGYQPVLASTWLNGMRTFGEEARQDRVFEELAFWVVTRSLQCFY